MDDGSTDATAEVEPVTVFQCQRHHQFLAVQGRAVARIHIGREEQIDDISDLIAEHRMVTLTGPGGMGKTSLALNVAQHAAVREGKKVGVFSLEMSKEQLALRLLRRARADVALLRHEAEDDCTAFAGPALAGTLYVPGADEFGTLLCTGIMVMFVFQIFENVGMTMGIMPITGIPLPFVSYGGSSTIALFAGLGLVQSVHMRRFT